MGITVKSEYAFRILLSIAGCNKLISLANASKDTKVPQEFAEKIVLQLRKAGIVKAKRGRTGGYELARMLRRLQLTTSSQRLTMSKKS